MPFNHSDVDFYQLLQLEKETELSAWINLCFIAFILFAHGHGVNTINLKNDYGDNITDHQPFILPFLWGCLRVNFFLKNIRTNLDSSAFQILMSIKIGDSFTMYLFPEFSNIQ